MEPVLRRYKPEDIADLAAVYNYFAKNSFAVYSEAPMPVSAFANSLLGKKSVLVLIVDEKIIGYGCIGEYKPLPNFAHTAVLAYFLLPEFTGHGHGTRLCNALFAEGLTMGITNFLVHISSKNEQSLNFHRKIGFRECGRLRNVATKFNQSVDVVWMQKEFPTQPIQ
jgi:phosphinothricin acetyltransferase